MRKPVYVLGTGLSHDGSAILLKDGKICVGIEKERLTRWKHDGGNDTLAVQYCLDTEGITLEDLTLVVQCANFEYPPAARYQGQRLFAALPLEKIVNISHHLAHAYSAAGTCPFDECMVLVIDGAGSPFEQCIDVSRGETSPEDLPALILQNLWCEKDSFYFFDGRRLSPLFKDFSEFDIENGRLFGHQTTKHSIGGFYSSISRYVFRDMDAAGKLMGLAPYGKKGRWSMEAFEYRSGRVFIGNNWQPVLNQPCKDEHQFKENFQYYADVACWAQAEVEKAVAYCFRQRLTRFPHPNVCFSGGVALNAVANAALLNKGIVENLYLEPAAGDNGLALGCAYYGWLELLGNSKVPANGDTCFGRVYSSADILEAVNPANTPFEIYTGDTEDAFLEEVACLLAEGRTVGWFQGGAEFGPRALGHRSILAHPGIEGLRDHINRNIKFREDFRPFAPAVLPAYAAEYFESGRPSPHMILVDRTREKYYSTLCNVTHVNGTARVQTVDPEWNRRFFRLLEIFREFTGIPVLLNTSLNKRGMPIVETPGEALSLFSETALDVLVLDTILVKKQDMIAPDKTVNTGNQTFQNPEH